MKTTVRFFFLVGLMVFIPVLSSFSQVAINATGDPPDNSAILDVKSVNKGVLIPRLTQSQIASISSPANGLLVYCVTDGKLYIYVKISAEWKEVAYGGSVISPPAFTCGSTFTVSHIASEGVAPVDKTVTYGTVTNLPGEASKCWITQNLGAIHQATSETDATDESAGWFWEFNRKQGYYFDGSTRKPATAWVTPIGENLDWKSAEDPCTIELGNGWRIPSYTEWNNVLTGGGWTVRNDLWNSGLKLHAAGGIMTNGAGLFARGEGVYFWSTMQQSNDMGLTLISNSPSDPVLIGGGMKTTGIPLRCVQGTSTPGLAVVTTAAATSITETSATSGGNVVSEGGATVTTRGICWSISSNPTLSDSYTSDGSGTGTFTSALTNLTTNTLYYLRAYATNSYGTAYGNTVSFNTLWACGSPITVAHTAGGVAPVDKIVTYGTATGIAGEPTKCWITQNLGADNQASSVNDATEASAGWYWQFNRKQGFQHNGTTRTPNTTWIFPIDENSNWLAENDPCTIVFGNGWRIPTFTEWLNVDAVGIWVDWTGPYSSALKLNAAGEVSSGGLFFRGTEGNYWGSTQNSNTHAAALEFKSFESQAIMTSKASGFSLRCLK